MRMQDETFVGLLEKLQALESDLAKSKQNATSVASLQEELIDLRMSGIRHPTPSKQAHHRDADHH